MQILGNIQKKLIPENLNSKIFLLLLIPSTIGYFMFVRLLQDWLTITNHYVADALPKYQILPEPLEIPLYLLGYIAIPLITRFFYYLYEKKILTYVLWIGGGVLIVGIIVFFQKLVGRLPNPQFFVTYFETHTINHALWLLFTKRLFVMQIVGGLSIALFLCLYLFWKKPNVELLKKISRALPLKRLVPLFFILLAVLVISPQFTYDETHYNFVIGTINDMQHGKPFLYETSNQYGVLNVYLLSIIFKYLTPLNYAVTSFIFSVLFFLFFIGTFFVIRHWLNSYAWAYFGTLATVTLNYFGNADPFYDAMRFPGPTPYRQGFNILVAFLLILYVKKKKIWLRELLLLSGGLAFFWNIDTGIYVAFALFSALACQHIASDASFRKKIVNIIKTGLHQFAYIISVFALLNVGNLIVFGKLPRWSLIIKAISYYETGLGKLPMPAIGIFEIFVLVYLGTLLWIIHRLYQKRSFDIPLVFFLMFGILSFHYYVGNSAWSYLFAVSPPLVLIAAYLFRVYFSTRAQDQISTGRLVTTAFYGSLAFIGFLLAFKLPMEFSKRDYRHFENKLALIQEADYDLSQDAEYIQTHFAETDRVPLFHVRDGKLLILAKKTNYFDFYDQNSINFKSQLNALVRQVRTEQPLFLLIGHERTEKFDMFEEGIRDLYVKDESLHTLDIYALRPSPSVY